MPFLIFGVVFVKKKLKTKGFMIEKIIKVNKILKIFISLKTGQI